MNLKNEIKDLVYNAEDEKVEFKAVLPPSKIIARVVSSFANTEGGYLILGVLQNQSGNSIKGLSEDFYAIETTHKAIDLLIPRPIVNYEYIVLDQKKLFIIKVAKSEESILVEGKRYVRVGAETKLVTIGRVTDKFKSKTYDRINNLFSQFEGYLKNGTTAKTKYFEHLLSVLKIIDDLGNILHPDKPEMPTTNQEGKVLCRILYSSFVDNFETYLSDILYEIFLAKPATLKSEQTVTIKEVLSCSDLQEFVHYWAKQKINKLQKGSVTGFIKENKQISKLNVINDEEQREIEKLLQIRHLYSHRNGIVDEKFLRFYTGEFELNTEHQMAISDICDKLNYLACIVDRLDNTAIDKYNLAT